MLLDDNGEEPPAPSMISYSVKDYFAPYYLVTLDGKNVTEDFLIAEQTRVALIYRNPDTHDVLMEDGHILFHWKQGYVKVYYEENAPPCIRHFLAAGSILTWNKCEYRFGLMTSTKQYFIDSINNWNKEVKQMTWPKWTMPEGQ